MQKKIIALAVAALASSAAFAQTNVTIYGVADVGVAYLTGKGIQHQLAVESGLLGGSRIGFKGTEDLGNGLKAVFTAEYALAMDDNAGIGAADQVGTFGSTPAAGVANTNTVASGSLARQQFVGLSGGFGTAVMGRLQTAGFDWSCAYNPLAGGALDALGKLGASTLLACGNAGRANNAIAYISPSFGGVTVAVNHARVTEAAQLQATLKDNTAWLGSVSYANGPVAAGLVYSKIFASATATSADSTTELGLGASYDFGVVKLLAAYQQKNATNVKGTDKKAALSLVAPVGKGAVVGSFARNWLGDNAVGHDNSNAYSLAYVHNLSKRTKLYGGWNHVNAGSAVPATAYAGVAATASTGAAPAYASVNGGSVNIFGLGVNHAF